MAVSNRVPILSRFLLALRHGDAMIQRVARAMTHARLHGLRHPGTQLVALVLMILPLQGCGLLFDAVHNIYPITANELDRICQRKQVQVGMAVEPFRPFVFPAVWTDEGAR